MKTGGDHERRVAAIKRWVKSIGMDEDAQVAFIYRFYQYPLLARRCTTVQGPVVLPLPQKLIEESKKSGLRLARENCVLQ